MMQCISNSRKSCLVDANSCFCYMVIVFILSFIGSTMAFTTPVVPTINANNSIESCMNVKDFFISRGISDKDIPERRLKGENIRENYYFLKNSLSISIRLFIFNFIECVLLGKIYIFLSYLR
jgi:hypothetical protein